MSRLLVEARVPISFNLFSSACKRRSISPVWAEVNWLNLDEPDIIDILLSCNEASPRKTPVRRRLFQALAGAAAVKYIAIRGDGQSLPAKGAPHGAGDVETASVSLNYFARPSEMIE